MFSSEDEMQIHRYSAHCGLLSSLVGPYFTGGGMFYKANLVISLFFYSISGEKDEKIHDECSSNAETS